MKRQAMVNMMLGGLITMANVYYLWGLNAAGLSGEEETRATITTAFR